MIKFILIIGFTIIFQCFQVKPDDLSYEVKNELCDSIVKSEYCDSNKLREFICENCQDKCKGKVDPDCNSFIGDDCKDRLSYCEDVASQCEESLLKSFLHTWCPVTCNKCIPIDITETTSEPKLVTTSELPSELIIEPISNITNTTA